MDYSYTDIFMDLFVTLTGNPLFLIVLIIFAGAIIASIVIIISERKKRLEWEQKLRESGISEVDTMTGKVFEMYLEGILKARGYGVRLTSTTGDFGADLILSTDENTTIVVQAKRYSKKVGVRAVQEIVSAKSYYGADECWVITNNYFTSPALELADSNGVILFDRDELVEWMIEYKQGA